jgi:protein-disulfide isomerase
MHPDALRAAEAAEAAGVQGKFWPMQDLLFQNQEELERENLVSYAKKLGLDVHQFQAELKAHTHRARIRRDLQSGNASGVDGTPSFFLNGMAYPGPIDLKSMISDIEEILAQRASGVKKAS